MGGGNRYYSVELFSPLKQQRKRKNLFLLGTEKVKGVGIC